MHSYTKCVPDSTLVPCRLLQSSHGRPYCPIQHNDSCNFQWPFLGCLGTIQDLGVEIVGGVYVVVVVVENVVSVSVGVIFLHNVGSSSEPSAQFVTPLHFKSPSIQAP